MSENTTGLTVTLKAGTGFEAPWIVIHAADATDALNQINTGDFATLAERTVSAAEFFRAAHNVKNGLAAREPAVQQPPQQEWNNTGSAPNWSQQGSQQAAPAPAAQDGKQCAHGAMVYREAKPGSGKTWRAYFCPTPQNTPGQCKPEFLK
jgi:hypothetical protein